jgi:hypothetical protein
MKRILATVLAVLALSTVALAKDKNREWQTAKVYQQSAPLSMFVPQCDGYPAGCTQWINVVGLTLADDQHMWLREIVTDPVKFELGASIMWARDRKYPRKIWVRMEHGERAFSEVDLNERVWPYSR